MKIGELDAHIGAKGGIKIGKRFVEQEYLRFTNDGATDGNALALSAGQHAGALLQALVELKNLRNALHLVLDLALFHLFDAQRKSDVFENSHMRIESIGLEDHGDTTLDRRQFIDLHAVDDDVAAGNILKAGDHAQQSGLAASRGADKNDELAIPDVELNALDDFEMSIVLADVVEIKLTQDLPLPSAAEIWPHSETFRTMRRKPRQTGTVEKHEKEQPQGAATNLTAKRTGCGHYARNRCNRIIYIARERQKPSLPHLPALPCR